MRSATTSPPQRQLAFDQMPEGPRAGAGSPEGLLYRPEFVTSDEEKELLEFVEALDFNAVKMHGQTARRTVRHFGYDYGYDSWKLAQGEPIPSELEWLRDRCASLASISSERLVQALVSRYPPGAGIGWHRDAPKFGPEVFGVSLLSPCRMRFQRRIKSERHVFVLELEPRSAYVLASEARSEWQHSIPPMKALRYSITFRTVRR